MLFACSFVFWIIFIRITCLWCFIIFNLTISTWLKFSLKWEKAWSTKSTYDSNFILFMFTTTWTFVLPVCFDTLLGNLIAILFHLWTDETKGVHSEQTILEIIVYLACHIKKLASLCDIALFLLKSLI